jgi:adenosylcobinamide kinase/adenosylcobinamide-phosphate guanylyltransferase
VDAEMTGRIEAHRAERGPVWQTVEAPIDLGAAICDLPPAATAIVDCCTVWLGNVWHKHGHSEDILSAEVGALREAVTTWRAQREGNLCLVTNEVGWGIVPHDPAVRRYRDWAGRMNQRLAEVANRVVLCVSGIGMEVKP